MKRFGLILVSALAVGVGLGGCQKDTQIHEELVEINKKLEALDKKIGAGGAAGARQARPKRQRPPSPNPKDVYAVDIAGAPYRGAKDAKVTVVKAFEFA